ncbi:hypothetical protein AURDEDRAFT_128549 [Auricularia subglabra TFB-10046 SS5]|uniref:RNase H type-1 domain-containing protein n=1 Tax=Auricularia subglabra (strain TFB-10046 / SS5) TaxID=717982 RepID=J0DBY7_AURST|nr:hypothetical protein AURDEDRAFT_128549 [Auricularia subglabra TFB-10046 SS5]
METLRLPKSHGGLNLFCAEERNEAQYLSWLSAYLAPQNERPLWVFVADELYRLAIRVSDASIIPEDYRTNPFSQDWRPNKNKLPFILKQILKVADKYHLTIDAPYIPQDTRKRMTAWAHPAMLDQENLRLRTPEARCLKRRHAVRNLDHLEEIAEQDEEDHTGADDCECPNCDADRVEGCRHPSRCQEFANDLLGGIAPKWNLASEQIELPGQLWQEMSENRDSALENGEEVVFNQLLGNSLDESDMFRVFVNSHALRPGTAREICLREPGIRNLPPSDASSVHVIACGSTIYGRSADARGGFAVHFPDAEYGDDSGRCAGSYQTEERSAAIAILRAAQIVPLDRTMHIVTNSKNVVKRICNKLEENDDAG